MGSLLNFVLALIAVLVAALVFWLCWGGVADLFPQVPKVWREIGYWDTFCLLWIWRVVTMVARQNICASKADK